MTIVPSKPAPSHDGGHRPSGDAMIILAPDQLSPDIGGRNAFISGVRRLTGGPALSLIVARARHLIATHPGSRVVANDAVAEAARGVIDPANVEGYERDLLLDVETSDYTPLHQFADALDDLSAQLDRSGQGGFHHRGISLVKIHEIRWIWPIAYTCSFARLCLDWITSSKARRLTALGWTTKLPAAIYAARRVQVRIGPVARAFASLSDQLEYRAHATFVGNIVPHWMEQASLDRSVPVMPYPTDKPAIVVVANFDRTLERLERLVPELQAADYTLHVVATRRLPSLDRLRAQGVDCTLAKDWLTPQDMRTITKEGTAKGKAWWQAVTRAAAAGRLAQTQGEIEIFDNARHVLRAHFLHGGPACMFAVEVAARVLDTYKPQLILNFEDWDLNRALSLMARQRNIPSLAYYCLSAPGHAALVRRTQDWMATSGENLRKAFVHQFAPGHIRVLGDPLVRPIEHRVDAEARRALRQQLGLHPDKPLIVLMGSYPTVGLTLDDLKTVFQRTVRAAALIGNVQVIVKSHPAQTAEQVKQWCVAWDCGDIPVVKDVSLFDLCEAAELASVPVTSGVHQALMAGIPVVCLQSRQSILPFESMGFDYLTGKGVVHVPVELDAAPVVARLLFDAEARKQQIAQGFQHVEEHSGPADNLCGQRLVAFIADILAATAPAPSAAGAPIAPGVAA